MAAFLAHYHALKSDAARSTDDEKVFAEMSATLATLAPESRAALDSTEDSASTKRHRDRAELQLRRELVAHGILAG